MTKVERSAISVSQFCRKYGISNAKYYELRNAGLSPRVLAISKNLVRILPEDEDAWVAKFLVEPKAHPEKIRSKSRFVQLRNSGDEADEPILVEEDDDEAVSDAVVDD